MFTRNTIPQLTKSSFSFVVRTSPVSQVSAYNCARLYTTTETFNDKEKGEEKYYVTRKEKELLEQLKKLKAENGGDLHKALESLSKSKK